MTRVAIAQVSRTAVSGLACRSGSTTLTAGSLTTWYARPTRPGGPAPPMAGVRSGWFGAPLLNRLGTPGPGWEASRSHEGGGRAQRAVHSEPRVAKSGEQHRMSRTEGWHRLPTTT